jgi:esterase/lipase
MSPVALPHLLCGTGPHRVIGLHGWSGDRDAFARIRPDLNGEAFTYAFPDYRGYGEARELTGEFTLAEGAR